jgi:hypothetical protein
LGYILALFTNVRLGWEGFPGTNTHLVQIFCFVYQTRKLECFSPENVLPLCQVFSRYGFSLTRIGLG